jgi:NifB/MoaA-like Fe-S oxidoreductase
MAARVIWSNQELTDSEKVEQLKWLNEIQHRVTAKIRVERMEIHPWSESEFCEMITENVKKCVAISSGVGWAISGAYEQLAKQ